MRKLVICLTVIMLMVGISGTGVMPVSANAGENMFSDAIFTSQETLKSTFHMDCADSVTLIKEGDVPMISVKRDGSPFESNRVISKQKVEASSFVYTVEAAATKISGAQYTEIPIIVGVKEGYGSYTQVYINKSVDNTVTVNVALLENGKFRKVWSQACNVGNAISDDTFFTVRLEVYEFDMDVYLEDEYITTITSTDDYTGYVGVRCTGAMKIKSMSLIEMEEEVMETPDHSDDSNADPVFPTAGQTSRPTLAPVKNTTAPVDEDANLSGTVVGGIVVGVIAVLCVGAAVTYTIIRRKKK